jgi:VanZ family protein
MKIPRDLTHKLTAVAAWAFLAFIVYATLTSIERRPELTDNGLYKALFTVLERVGAYGVLGILFYFAYPRRVMFVSVLVTGSAGILEILQMFVPDRDARVLDALEKLAGGVGGILVAKAIFALIRYERRRHNSSRSAAYPGVTDKLPEGAKRGLTKDPNDVGDRLADGRCSPLR